MSDSFDLKKHSVSITNREVIELSGVSDVDSFNAEELRAMSDFGELLIRGSDLNVEVLDLESSRLKVTGKITALVYTDKTQGKGFFGRIFT